MGKWKPPEKTPLKGMKRCYETDCPNGLHCFLKHRSRKTRDGTCLRCGVELIDWRRVHRRDLHDVEHTNNALQNEHIRHEFWCAVPLSERALTYARRYGRARLIDLARKRIRSSVGRPASSWDGRQTPFEDKGHILHYAQHATATCCRKCIEVWHGVPRDVSLSGEDIEYFAQLLFRYVVSRIPDLPDAPLRAPRTLRKVGRFVERLVGRTG
jgi:hypothetical protein